MRVGPLADEPRGKHLGVVHYEQVVRRDVLDDVCDMPVFDDARRAVEHHHFLGAALFGGVLRYQPLWKRIPKLPCLHYFLQRWVETPLATTWSVSPTMPISLTPGVSITIAPDGSMTSSRLVVVWRPLPDHS